MRVFMPIAVVALLVGLPAMTLAANQGQFFDMATMGLPMVGSAAP